MGRAELERSVQQSVLDRLLEAEDADGATSIGGVAGVDGAHRAAEPWGPLARARSLAQLKAALRRDLEWLLNTNRVDDEVPEWCTRLRRSLYCYGLPDINSISRDSATELTRLLRQVEEAIAVFEPRLKDVRVSRVEGVDQRRQLRFLIEAVLHTEPTPERVVFDAVLEVGSGEYRVRGGGRA
jgi:type VI secretion system protein ImpF